MMTTNGSTVAALSLTSILAATPFGISVETIVVATGFTMLGVFGRLGFEIAKTADTPEGVRWGKVAALFGGGMVSASALTVLFLAMLGALGIKSDSIVIIGLVFFGFSGPRAILWLFNAAASVLNKRLGLNIPLVGVPADGAAKP